MSNTTTLRLTPTARLARRLRSLERDSRRAQGDHSWQPDPVLPFSAWLAALRQDALLYGEDDRAPLNAEQSLALWQQLVASEVFIGDRDVAQLAQRAWRALHEHQLEGPEHWSTLELSTDSALFRDWAQAFSAYGDAHRWQDEWSFASSLPGLIEQQVLPLPATLELCGFDRPLTALQQKIIDALRSAGVTVSGVPAPSATPTAPVVVRELLSFDTAEAELQAALSWARAELVTAPDASLAIVVPDLGARVAEAERLAAQMLSPAAFELRGPASDAVHISLGKPLTSYALVADALAFLALPAGAISHPQAHALLHAPWLPGAAAEQPARSRALDRWARYAPFLLTWDELQRYLEEAAAPEALAVLGRWRAARTETPDLLWPSNWARYWQDELSALAFGQGRALTSEQFQVLGRWHELLERFATLDAVLDGPMQREPALKLLRERCQGTIFRRRNPGAAIEILGVEEALGSRFDGAWITTLDQDHWPGPSAREPLLPRRLQAAIPGATAASALARAREELAALTGIAPALRGSFATGLTETPRSLSALVDPRTLQRAPAAGVPEQAALEVLERDAQAPALTEPQERGGAGLLQHQSDCPFRAFAQHRLGAAEQRSPRPGLAPGSRGELLHRALELLWQQVRSSEALADLDERARQALINASAQAAVDELRRRFRLALSRAGAVIEVRRIASTMQRWLAEDLARDPFTVEATEAELTLSFGALQLKGKVDRIDALEDGRRLIIDYKSSSHSPALWAPGPRLAGPQLPAYLLSAEPPAQGIAFAVARSNEARFRGLIDSEGKTANLGSRGKPRAPFDTFEDWQALKAAWREGLTHLADGFAGGDATVDPREPQVCTWCHLRALCRISERDSAFAHPSLADDDA
ncbi:MAG: PD-(D/E)XK nuclease family protein [Pseudomonadota bacterium]